MLLYFALEFGWIKRSVNVSTVYVTHVTYYQTVKPPIDPQSSCYAYRKQNKCFIPFIPFFSACAPDLQNENHIIPACVLIGGNNLQFNVCVFLYCLRPLYIMHKVKVVCFKGTQQTVLLHLVVFIWNAFPTTDWVSTVMELILLSWLWHIFERLEIDLKMKKCITIDLFQPHKWPQFMLD